MATSATGVTSTSAIPERRLPVEEDEEPPPYSVSPDVHHGEATLEYGPSRPYQRPPPRPVAFPSPPPAQMAYSPPPHPTGTSGGSSQRLGSLWNQLTGQLQEFANVANERVGRLNNGSTGLYGSQSSSAHGGWSAYPGHPSSSAPPPFPARLPHNAQNGLAPPPRHPASNSHPALSNQHPASHSDPHLPRGPPSSSETANRRASSDFARDFYAAGPEVPPDLGSPSGATSNAVSSQATGSSAAANVPGKPTTEPTAGHPLLKNGKLLVYPKGYECDKCSNTGYKLPSLKPCKRCWPKYGKQFSGPLAYSFGESTSNSASNFQRPLPASAVQSLPSGSGSSNNFASSAFRAPLVPSTPATTQYCQGYRPQPVVVPPHRLGMPHVMSSNYGGRMPGNSIVYAAGDPRIGGKRCWRCDGSGTVSLMFIDREQCSVCGGLGRTFR